MPAFAPVASAPVAAPLIEIAGVALVKIKNEAWQAAEFNPKLRGRFKWRAESLSNGETRIRARARIRRRAESLNNSETRNKTKKEVKLRAETANSNEARNKTKFELKLRAESLNNTESRLRPRTRIFRKAETANSNETKLRFRAMVRRRAESNSLSEMLLRARARIKRRAETANTSEARSRIRYRIYRKAETAQSSETRYRFKAMNRLRAEALSVAENVIDFLLYLLMPVAQIDNENWTDQDGEGDNIYTAIDELTSPEDLDYIKSPEAPNGETASFFLAPYGYELREPVTLRVRARSIAGATLTAKLFDGDTEIASWPVNGLTSEFQTFEFHLTTLQAQALANSVDRRLTFTANSS